MQIQTIRIGARLERTKVSPQIDSLKFNTTTIEKFYKPGRPSNDSYHISQPCMTILCGPEACPETYI